MAVFSSVISHELLKMGLISHAQLSKFASLSEDDKMLNLHHLGLSPMTELANNTHKWEQFNSLPMKNKVEVVKGLAKLKILGMDTLEDMKNMETVDLHSFFGFNFLDMPQQFKYDTIFSFARPGQWCYKGSINQDGIDVDVQLSYGSEDLDYSLSQLIVNVNKVNLGTCVGDEPLKWDMRASWNHAEYDYTINEWVGDSSKIGQDCNFAMMGGVYDPRRACPHNSDQFVNCEKLNRYNDIFTTQCTNILTYPNRFGVAIGDLSGIHGEIDYTGGAITIDNVTPYFDPANYNKRMRENSWASMSFSCQDGTPAFCLKLEQVICGTDIHLPVINNLLFNKFLENGKEKLILEKLTNEFAQG